MPERPTQLRLPLGRGGSALLATLGLVLTFAAVAWAATPRAKHAHKAPTPLIGVLSQGPVFPQRALLLTPPPHLTLTSTAVNLTEDGRPVTSFSLDPLSAGVPGDLGTVVVLDQGASMAGSAMTAAVNAVRGVAASRPGSEQLGIVTFDSAPTNYLPLTANSSRISQILKGTPWTGTGADVASAERLALKELAAAHVAAGAIVVVSDGVGVAASPATRAAGLVAAAQHVGVVTVGVADKASSAVGFRALSQAVPGTFDPATTAQLPSVLAGAEKMLSAGYVLRWRSTAPYGQTADVVLKVNGVPGTVAASYQAPPAPAPVAPAPVAPTPAPPVHHAAPVPPRVALSFSSHFAPRTALSNRPEFDPAAPPSAPTLLQPQMTQTFWTSTAGSLTIAGLCGVLVTLMLVLALHRPSQKAARVRVGSFVPIAPEADDPVISPTATKRSIGISMLARRNWWPPFVRAVEISRSRHTPIGLVKRAASIGMVLSVIITVALGGALYGLVALIVWPFALRWWVYRAADKQRAKFRDTLPSYLQDLASAIRVGRSFVAGLAVVAETADEPTRSELERAVTDEALGRPLEQSLELVAQRMQNNDLDQIALIAALNRRSGSNIAEALDRVAEGARDRADLRREIRALTAQAKMSSMVLTGLPGVLLVGLSVVSPRYAYPLFHTTIGLVCLGVGTVLVIAGWKVMQKITRVEA